MQTFQSFESARTHIAEVVDQPLLPRTVEIRPGVMLRKSVFDKTGGMFANVYDVSFDDADVHPEIIAFNGLSSAHKLLARSGTNRYSVATNGGFFYLADQGSSVPRHQALNLSISRGDLMSLPVADRQTVMAGPEGLTARRLVALGNMSINGHDLMWSGSLTDYDTDAKVFGNGNVVINHVADPVTGARRVLDEASRYTPPIQGDGLMDVGFIGRGDNEFVGVGGSKTGGVDIFAHDFVVRCSERYFHGVSMATVHSVGGIALERFTGGAFSAGPALNTADFTNDPINADRSLGSKPPFRDVCLARTVLFGTEDGQVHIRLFDGRPGSDVFPGVTPSEAVTQIMETDGFTWGCFLDPGQTAKLSVRDGDVVTSYGNRHYLRWPSPANPNFVWTPDSGRHVANAIAL